MNNELLSLVVANKRIRFVAVLLLIFIFASVLYVYSTNGHITVVTNNPDNVVSLIKAGGTKSVVKTSQGGLDTTLRAGNYMVSVQNKNSGVTESVLIKGHHHSTYRINIPSVISPQSVLSYGALSLAANHSQLFYLDYDSNNLYKLDGGGVPAPINIAGGFSNIGWENAGFGIGQTADGQPFKRLSQRHNLPVVLFEPDHLHLLSGSPERRRDYLDELLEQTRPGYGATRRQYKRALAQRNRLLKQPVRVSAEQLFPWDVRLSQLAGRIVRARQELAGTINADLGALYKQLSQTKTKVAVAYSSSWPADTYESQLLKKLDAGRADDLARGFTGSGPHREDMAVSFNGRPAAETASRGEVRTAVLTFKIMELKIFQTAREGQPPLLLLDDVFSELDGKRRHALTDYLSPYQTFITTTDADLVVQHFTTLAHTIPLNRAR